MHAEALLTGAEHRWHAPELGFHAVTVKKKKKIRLEYVENSHC